MQWIDDSDELIGRTCPVLLLHERGDYFFAYDLFERHGVLPESGGWSEQGAHWIGAFRIIRDVIADMRMEHSQPETGESD
jgi:hypothetical protein